MSVYGFLPGQQCYKYTLDVLISNPTNSQSDVWLARDEATARRVALKIMDASHNQIPTRLYEAKFGAKLKHNNLCEVVGADVFETAMRSPLGHLVPTSFVAIAFQYQAAGACTKLLEGPGILPVKSVHRMLMDVLSGLEYLHEQGWRHNDVKPANILIGEQGEFMLTDYGIAWEPTNGTTSASFYMPHAAPESLQESDGQYTTNHAPSAHTDLYQLGVTAYRLLNGVDCVRDEFAKAQQQHDIGRFFEQVKKGKIPNRQSYAPWVPRRLQQIVNKAMHPIAECRYPSALAMRRDLEKLHFPCEWLFESSGEMACTSADVIHRIEQIQRQGEWEVALVKTYPSGTVRRPRQFVAKHLCRAAAERHVKEIMQYVLQT